MARNRSFNFTYTLEIKDAQGEILEVDVKVDATYMPGYPGSYYDPPEDDEVEINGFHALKPEHRELVKNFDDEDQIEKIAQYALENYDDDDGYADYMIDRLRDEKLERDRE